MKGHIILVSVLVLLPSLVLGQQKDSDQWGQIIKGRSEPVVLAQDDSCIYLAKIRPKTFQYLPHDYKCSIVRMHRDFTHAVESRFKMRWHFFLQCYGAVGKDILVFSAVSDTAHHETVLYAQVVNKKTLALEAPVRVLSLEGTYKKADFRLVSSPDKRKYLIYAATNKQGVNSGPRPLLSADKISFWIIDQQLNVISTNTKPINFLKPKAVFTEPQLAIDNNENVYILGRVYESTREWGDVTQIQVPMDNSFRNSRLNPNTYFAHHKYYVCIYPRGGQPDVHPIDIGEYLRNVELVVSSRQEVYIVGIYANDFKSRFSGCIAIKIKPHSDVFAFKTLYPYWDLITSGQSEQEIVNTNYSLPGVFARAMADSSLIITLNVTTYKFFNRPVTEVAMIRLAPDGKVTKEGIVLKQSYRAFATNPESRSIHRIHLHGTPAGEISGITQSRMQGETRSGHVKEFKYKGEIALIYNQLPEDALMMTTIASDGAVTTRSLLSNGKFKPIPLLTTYDSTGLILTRRHRHKYQLRRIVANPD